MISGSLTVSTRRSLTPIQQSARMVVLLLAWIAASRRLTIGGGNLAGEREALEVVQCLRGDLARNCVVHESRRCLTDHSVRRIQQHVHLHHCAWLSPRWNESHRALLQWR